jgi:energy-coupling factor transporter ATP-binding protein EcfA2
MSSSYRNFFGFSKEPFSSDIEIKNIIQTPEIKAINDRFDYTVKLGAIALVTGEIGAGKSTALRWIVAQLHPARFRPIWITASSGSILEVYRQILAEFEIKTDFLQKYMPSSKVKVTKISQSNLYYNMKYSIECAFRYMEGKHFKMPKDESEKHLYPYEICQGKKVVQIKYSPKNSSTKIKQDVMNQREVKGW